MNARRLELYEKGIEDGLTDEEMREYRRVRQRVSRYIKRTWPENWESVKYLTRHSRARFKKRGVA